MGDTIMNIEEKYRNKLLVLRKSTGGDDLRILLVGSDFNNLVTVYVLGTEQNLRDLDFFLKKRGASISIDDLEEWLVNRCMHTHIKGPMCGVWAIKRKFEKRVKKAGLYISCKELEILLFLFRTAEVAETYQMSETECDEMINEMYERLRTE